MRVLSAKVGWIQGLAFSPDSRTLAVVGEDCTIRLWDVPSFRERARLATGTDGGVRLAFSPDGGVLVSNGRPGELRWWDVAGGQLREKAVVDSPYAVQSLAFAPDGRTLAAGAFGGVQLWDVAARTQQDALSVCHLFELVDRVVFTPDGRSLLLTVYDRASGDIVTQEVQGWDLAPAGLRWRHMHVDCVEGLALAPDGRTLALSLEAEGAVHLLDAASGEEAPPGQLAGEARVVKAVAFVPGRALLAAACEDGTVRFWDLVTGRMCGAFDWQVGPLNELAVAPDGMTAAAGGERGEVFWDLEDLPR